MTLNCSHLSEKKCSVFILFQIINVNVPSSCCIFFCHYAFLLICAIHQLIRCSWSLSYHPFVVSVSSSRLVSPEKHASSHFNCHLLSPGPVSSSQSWYPSPPSVSSFILAASQHTRSLSVCSCFSPHVPRITCNFT